MDIVLESTEDSTYIILEGGLRGETGPSVDLTDLEADIVALAVAL